MEDAPRFAMAGILAAFPVSTWRGGSVRHITLTRCFLPLVVLALAGCSSSSPTQSGSTAQPSALAAAPIVVPAETVIVVTLDQTVSTKTNEAGDAFAATVAAPVTVDGSEIVPQGAKAAGHVTTADKAGRVKGGARLELNLDSLTVGGQEHQIHTAAVEEEGKGRGKRTAIGAGGGAAVGAIVGAIAGGGKGAAIGAGVGAGGGTAGAVFTGNRDISIPAETKLRFRLTQAVEIPAR